MISRRVILSAGALALTWRPLRTEARDGPFRIGALASSTTDRTAANLVPFRQKLASLGYTEGGDFVLDIRSANGRFDRLPALAAELAALHPDVIYAWSTPSLMAVYKLNTGIPVVFAGIGPDPVGLGIVQSIQHPGGDFTGVTNNAVELNPKRLEMLRDLLPQAKRLVHFSNPLNPGGTPAYFKAVDEAAAKVGFQLQHIDVKAAEDFPAAFAKIVELKADAIFGSADPLSIANRAVIIQFAAEHKLPAIYHFRFEAADGGLIAYGTDMEAQYRTAAIYVDKVLKGEKTADLPVEQATKLALVINLKTAREIGLTVPPLLLTRADEVIE